MKVLQLPNKYFRIFALYTLNKLMEVLTYFDIKNLT